MAADLKWGNVSVPHTAMWTDEAAGRAPFIRHERWSGQRLAMLCEGINQQTGKPLFAMLHADRCREVLRNSTCQMCLQALPKRVWTINQDQRDGGRPLISDGLPMCPECAIGAFQACPGMQRQAEESMLRVWESPLSAWLFAPVLLGPVPVNKGGDERTNTLLRKARGPVFTGPKLVLTKFCAVPVISLFSPSPHA